jgi:hypothetical protein
MGWESGPYQQGQPCKINQIEASAAYFCKNEVELATLRLFVMHHLSLLISFGEHLGAIKALPSSPAFPRT